MPPPSAPRGRKAKVEATPAPTQAELTAARSARGALFDGDTKRKGGDLSGAAIAYLRALQVDRDSGTAQERIALLHLMSGDLERAQATFETALRANPMSLTSHLGYGLAQLQRGKLQGARASLERALEMDEDSIVATLGLGLIHDQGERHAEAQAYYRRALALEPGAADIENNLGVSLTLSDEYDEAEQHLRRATLLDPANPESSANLGIVLARTGRYEEALASFRVHLDDASAHNNVGYVAFLNGDAARAIAHYELALRAGPKQPLPIIENLREAEREIERLRNAPDADEPAPVGADAAAPLSPLDASAPTDASVGDPVAVDATTSEPLEPATLPGGAAAPASLVPGEASGKTPSLAPDPARVAQDVATEDATGASEAAAASPGRAGRAAPRDTDPDPTTVGEADGDDTPLVAPAAASPRFEPAADAAEPAADATDATDGWVDAPVPTPSGVAGRARILDPDAPAPEPSGTPVLSMTGTPPVPIGHGHEADGSTTSTASVPEAPGDVTTAREALGQTRTGERAPPGNAAVPTPLDAPAERLSVPALLAPSLGLTPTTGNVPRFQASALPLPAAPDVGHGAPTHESARQIRVPAGAEPGAVELDAVPSLPPAQPASATERSAPLPVRPPGSTEAIPADSSPASASP
jgi:Tfp pilus assembly protein PilF